MFGTGTRGFAIITVVLAIGTYVEVFGLLHPTTQKNSVEGFKKSLSFPWTAGKIKQETHDGNQSQPLKAGKGKVKQEELKKGYQVDFRGMMLQGNLNSRRSRHSCQGFGSGSGR
jgi:hypothetical protein